MGAGVVVAVVSSGLGGQGCCTVALSFSKGQKECLQSNPLRQAIIWSKCGGETFDIFRNASLYVWVVSQPHTLHQNLCVWHRNIHLHES